MIKKICLLVVLVSSMYLMGCQQNPVTTQPLDLGTGGKDYFPNKDGNSWTYKFTVGTISSNNIIYTFNGTTTYQGQTVQIREQTQPSDPLAGIKKEYWLIDDNKAVNYGYTGSLTTTGVTYAVFPIKVGSTWTFVGNIKATVVSSENITVAAGKFDCFKIVYSSPEMTIDVWVSKNVGMVKTEAIQNNLKGSFELISKNF